MAGKLDLAAEQARYGRRPYWLSLLIAIDQLANAALWGYVDETLSSRAHRSAAAAKPKRRWVMAEQVIDALFAWDRQVVGERTIGHCELAYLGELALEHLPREYRPSVE